MNPYRCSHCGKTEDRDSDKFWLWSYCEKVGKNVRIHKVNQRIKAMSESNVMAELPRYQSHKEVRALKIKKLDVQPDGSVILHPEEPGYSAFKLPDEYVKKHAPQEGGYYVVYEDGYKSFSPAKAFESGYTEIK